MKNAFELYMSQISKIEMLPQEEQRKLFYYARQGDIVARNKIILANLRLVVNIAYTYTKDADLLIELIQEGNLGLIKAVERFDPDKGYKFSTYASWWIKHYILDWLTLREQDVKIPKRLLIEIKKIKKELTPTQQNIEAYLADNNITGKRATFLREVTNGYQFGELSERLSSIAAGASSVEQDAFKQMLYSDIIKVLKKLTKRERLIIMYRFGFIDGKKHSLARIGQRFGLSAEGVRQIILRVLRFIKSENGLDI